MRQRLLFIVALVGSAICSYCFGSEPDLYTCRVQVEKGQTCPKALVDQKDSLKPFDRWTNDRLDELTKQLNENGIRTAEEAFIEFGKHFYLVDTEEKIKSKTRHKNPVELWEEAYAEEAKTLFGKIESWENKGETIFARHTPKEVSFLVDEMGGVGGGTIRASYFFGKPTFATQPLRQTALDLMYTPIYKIAGVLVAGDKISHFFSQGWDYYKVFLEEKKRAPDADEKTLRANVLAAGHKEEVGMQGEQVDGIYSFADLAANWQGFLFFLDLWDGKHAYFTYDTKTGEWKRTGRQFTFAQYVHNNWDEALNPPSLSRKEFREKLHTWIKTQYCPQYLTNPTRFLNETKKIDSAIYRGNDPDTTQRLRNREALKMTNLCKGK